MRLEPHSPLASRAAQHYLIAVGILTHGEVGWLAIFGLGCALALAARSDDFRGAGDHIGNLKGEPGPCALAVPAGVDGDEAARDREFGDVRVLPRDARSETGLVECDRARCVGRPDGVFEFFDMHDVDNLSVEMRSKRYFWCFRLALRGAVLKLPPLSYL
jgi:hypothetical protein